ncbi:glycosyltransferase family 2 protein [Streptococcus thermophilus]|uniref:glycosyltransferase family 2 protein n=1 Tax=Streptococcus thermophilus TaxID=1308 RepID=UPI00321BEBBF
MNPLISIIVPTYNVEKYIRTCIESILAQTYRNVEVIIVNDGSTDQLLAVISDLICSHHNVKLR